MLAAPENRTKVLLVGPKPPARGGVAQFIANCCKATSDFDFEVFDTGRLILDGSSGRMAKGYGDALEAGMSVAFQKLFSTLKHLCHYPFFLRKAKPSIVQIQFSLNWSFWENAFYLMVARLLGLKTIIRLGSSNMESFFAESKKMSFHLKRKVLNSADRVIVQSRYWHRFFSRMIPEERLVIIGNAVSIAPVLQERRQDGRIHVLFEGGKDALRKGAFDVLAAAEILRGEGCQRCQFHCMAATPEIAQKVDALHLRDSVDLHLYMSGKEKEEIFAQCHVFLLPSYSEGFPHSLLEAMSFGHAVIATPVGAVPEIVTEGNNGYIIRPGDVKALAIALKCLSGDHQKMADMGRKNYELVSGHFSIDMLGQKLSALYARVQ